MKKNDLLINEKLKGFMTISSIIIPHKIKVQLEFTEHFFILKFLDLKNKIKDIVEQIFFPLYEKYPNIYYINYTLVKLINIIDLTGLKITMINPKTSFTFHLTIKNIEIIGVLFNKKINFEGLNTLNRKLTNLINLEIKYLIGQFLYLFTLLRDCLDPKKNENTTIEEILFKSYIAGKAYYEKYINELKKNSKLRLGIKRIVLDKIDKMNKLRNNNISDSEDEENEEATREKYFLNYTANNNNNINDFNESNINGGSFDNYNINSFDSLINEFKLRTSVNIEESIILFFKIISIDSNKFNIKFKNSDTKTITLNLKSVNEREKKKIGNKINKINKYIPSQGNISANIPRKSLNLFERKNYHIDINKMNNLNNENFSESTKNTSNKILETNKNNNNANNSLIETPKFCFKKNQIDDSQNDNLSLNEVYKLIEECSKQHSFLPPNETFNIFFNTTEIIHRKFFEIFFNELIGKIFKYEKDKDNLIKLDSLYNYFLYLRGLKNILFVEKNRIYFSNVFFMDDEDD